MKKVCLILPVFFWVLSFPLQIHADSNTIYPKTVKDDTGRNVHLKSSPERIVSLAPAATEILFFIGTGSRIVGVTKYCDYPNNVKNIPVVGDFINPDIEKILGLSPSLVVLTSFVQSGIPMKLNTFGIPYYISYPSSPDSLPSCFSRLADLCGTLEKSKKKIAGFRKQLWDFKKEISQAKKTTGEVKVFFEISSNPLMSVSGNSFEGAMIELAGGESCTEDLTQTYGTVNPERIIGMNPDVIIVAHNGCNESSIRARRGWKRVNAVKHGRIVSGVDVNLLVRPGPRSMDGAKILAEAFFPEYPFSWKTERK